MAASREKFMKARNELIAEVVEEMGQEQAYRYFQDPSHRQAIEAIAEARAFWTPDRDLSMEQFVGAKWKKTATAK